MLRAVLNIHWSTHPTKERLYGDLAQITSVIKERRTRLAGHCYRSKNEVISDLILWSPKHGKRKVGRPNKTFVRQLTDDVNCELEDLPKLMEDRTLWKDRVKLVRAIRPIW